MKFVKKWMVVPYQEQKIENTTPTVDEKILKLLKRKNLSKDIKVKLFNHLMSKNLKSPMDSEKLIKQNDIKNIINEAEAKNKVEKPRNTNETISSDIRNSYRDQPITDDEDDDDVDNYNSSNTTLNNSQFLDTGILHLSDSVNDTDTSAMQVDEPEKDFELKLNNSLRRILPSLLTTNPDILKAALNSSDFKNTNITRSQKKNKSVILQPKLDLSKTNINQTGIKDWDGLVNNSRKK
jgi:hypothetical protein